MSYKIDIPKPCTADWDGMTVEGRNRYCSSCEKTVHDFTGFSNKQLMGAIKPGSQVCGRLKKSQFIAESKNSRTAIPFSRAGMLLGFTAIFGVSTPVIAQGEVKKIEVREYSNSQPEQQRRITDSISIKGSVTGEEDNIPLPGANVILKGTQYGAQTDFDGDFEIKFPAEVLKEFQWIEISYLGYQSQEFKINETNRKINVSLVYDDSALLGDVIVVGGIRSGNFFHRIGNFFRRLF